MPVAWAIASPQSSARGRRSRPRRPDKPGWSRQATLAALVVLGISSCPVLAQQLLLPRPVLVAQRSRSTPRPASASPAATSQRPAAADPASKSAANGCSLSLDQIQQVARGQVLRLGRGDCQMRFNTVR